MTQKRRQEPIAERPGGCCALLVPDTFSEPERSKTLVVGIGSAHGDDQAGWMVAQAVAEKVATEDCVSVRLAKNPLDLLGWLDGVERLHVCDACNVFETAGTLHQYEWKSGKLLLGSEHSESEATEPETVQILLPFRHRSSHDFGLAETLQLAAITSRMPSQITIWAIEAANFSPGDSISESTLLAVLKASEKVTRLIRSGSRANENSNA